MGLVIPLICVGTRQGRRLSSSAVRNGGERRLTDCPWGRTVSPQRVALSISISLLTSGIAPPGALVLALGDVRK